MPTAVELTKRMNSIEMISKMTRAMQLISSIRMRKSKRLLAEALPYSVHCIRTMERVLMLSPNLESPYTCFREKKKGDPWRLDVYVLTADQGFDGTYNADVVTATRRFLRKRIKEIEAMDYIPFITLYLAGSRGRDELASDGYLIDEKFRFSFQEPRYVQAEELAEQIFLDYQHRETDEAHLIYSMMRTPISSAPLYIRLLPADLQGLRRVIEIAVDDPDVMDALPPGFPGEPRSIPFDYPSDIETLMEYLFSTYLSGVVYGALVEAYAGEQTARMTSMDNASSNSADLMRRLRDQRNRLRQNAITGELLEMSASVEAMRHFNAGMTAMPHEKRD
ncbi:MAG TPA: FoF1 ATP synthase subunit gamma [Clostridia bacterium]|nr:FoF1 ATP synthase subunit gamma [Clostridia bacterium]